jgi:hypothetical protein
MAVDEKNEGERAASNAEGTGGQAPQGTTRPPTPQTGGVVNRSGTKEDIRSAGTKEGGSAQTPRDRLRDGK